MIAYFIHDPEKGTDHFFTPETDQLIQASRDAMNLFISPQPDFNQWQGEAMAGRAPETFGVIVASRRDDGDVCIMEPTLWQERMASLLGAPAP